MSIPTYRSAHDLDSGMKHDAAVALLRQLWDLETGILSTQVIQEFYVNVTRKIPRPLSPAKARGLIENYFAWPVIINDTENIRRASEIEETVPAFFLGRPDYCCRR